MTEEERTTSIGLCLQAKSYLKTAEFCLIAEGRSELNLRFNDPIVFLVSHGLELLLKAWLRTKDFDLVQFKRIGHNLTRAYKLSKRQSFPVDENALLLEWVKKNSALHLTVSGPTSESERVLTISKCRRDRELWRHIWLLGKLHGAPFVVRYHRTGYYQYPDINFILFCALKLCESIEPLCLQHYNSKKLASC